MATQETFEQIERVFFEHISFLYKTIVIATIIFLVAIAAAIVLGIWWLGLIGLSAYGLVYLKKKRRNRFLLTNTRFIRELYNPHHSIVAVPLSEITDVKIKSRANDKYGTIRIETAPSFGDQLLVDGEREYGVIMCYKVSEHATARDIIAFAAEQAREAL